MANRKKYMIGGVLQVASAGLSLYNQQQAAKLARDQERTQRELEHKLQYENDLAFLDTYNSSGSSTNYYKKGGMFSLNKRNVGNKKNFKPMGDGVFEINGPSHNSGGVKLGKAEVEGGELIRVTPGGIKVLSDSTKDFGFSPAKNATKGNRTTARNFEDSYALQETIKAIQGVDSSKKKFKKGSTIDPSMLTTEQEKPLQLESWMTDSNVWDTNGTSSNSEELKPTVYGGNYNAAPYLIDNVMNLITTANTPKVPKPAMMPLVRLNSDVNFDPQISAVKENERNNINLIDKGISDANAATALKIKAGNVATNDINAIRANEFNAEQDIRNKEATANVYPNMINTQSINQFGQQNMQRQLGINQSLNKIFDNASRDLIDLEDKRRFDNRDKDRLRTQLAMDTEGSLAYVVRDTNAFDQVIADPNFNYKNYHPSLIREISKKRALLSQQNQ